MAGDDAAGHDARGAPLPGDRRGLRIRPPITTKADFPKLEVASHRALVVEQERIVERFNAHPELAVLFFVNPVLAFREFGVTLSPEMADHLLHALQHPPKLRARREALEQSLAERLGAPPQPNDARWLATTLFETLEIEPLQTAGQQPAYVPALPRDVLDRLAKLRPRFRNRRGDTPRRLSGMGVRIREWHPTARRMDLESAAPALPRAARPPASVTLEELWFYKDASPVARELLELGIIRRRAFPIQSADSYRKIRAGEKANAFRGWITGLRFPPLRDPEAATRPPAPGPPPAPTTTPTAKPSPKPRKRTE